MLCMHWWCHQDFRRRGKWVFYWSPSRPRDRQRSFTHLWRMQSAISAFRELPGRLRLTFANNWWTKVSIQRLAKVLCAVIERSLLLVNVSNRCYNIGRVSWSIYCRMSWRFTASARASNCTWWTRVLGGCRWRWPGRKRRSARTSPACTCRRCTSRICCSLPDTPTPCKTCHPAAEKATISGMYRRDDKEVLGERMIPCALILMRIMHSPCPFLEEGFTFLDVHSIFLYMFILK